MTTHQRGALTLATPLALAALLAGCGQAPTPQAGPIRITGSSTVFPILKLAVAGYGATARGRDVTVELSEVGTSAGLRAFCAGEAPIANASRPISTKELQACAAKGITFIELPLAFDAISVVVSGGNDWASSISTQELSRTWSAPAQGTVKAWNQVNSDWPERPLRLCSPGKDSGTFDYFNEAINGNKANSRTDVETSEDDNVIVACVADDPNAMGYLALATTRPMPSSSRPSRLTRPLAGLSPPRCRRSRTAATSRCRDRCSST
ncbi:substrate-binding domain-containing protein [Cyanobium sp. LEGE 06113]|uniref:substrate-binding domain-containing protein n=1 Tax=Cyanobium sp. LEGE 06113 TaxID=1297573 RepID=UPI00188090F2|nr:substrate-binding domain-containing protein [Cyanobium sp. LEGE 06113]MBE9153742.1 substrate-binding domain-containing protein [Cyanobium sp. LEGE 06113]